MKGQWKHLLSSFIRNLGYLLAIGTLVLGGLEISYRYQVIEFYQDWLNGLNEPELNPSKPTTLVFGDSFTAHHESYVKSMRTAFPERNIINAAISGTGIRQHNLIVANRIKEYQPQQVIYQFYVGNDFTDVEHPINFKTNSMVRNVYWLLADRLLFMTYLNSKLAPFSQSKTDSSGLRNDSFSSSAYNHRVKTYFKAEPSHLENTILLQGDQKPIYQKWKNYFLEFLTKIPEDVPVTFIVIPHCAQVSDYYQNNMKLIGATFKSSLQEIDYPLIQQLKKDFPQLQMINPLFNFQQLEENGTQLFYSNDPHMTLEGQKLLGKYLNAQLVELNPSN